MNDWLARSSAEKDMGVTTDKKLNKSTILYCCKKSQYHAGIETQRIGKDPQGSGSLNPV